MKKSVKIAVFFEKKKLKKNNKNRIHLTGSQIALFSITNNRLKMKQWVRNRVVQINRSTPRDKWYYLESENMMVDLGTRKGAQIKDVSEDGPWMSGKSWTKLPKEHFPIKPPPQIKLTKGEMNAHREESIVFDEEWINKTITYHNKFTFVSSNQGIPSELGER